MREDDGTKRLGEERNVGSWSVSSLYADFGERPNHFCDSGFCSFRWGRVTRLAVLIVSLCRFLGDDR